MVSWQRESVREILWMLQDYQGTHLEDDREGRPRPCICWPDGGTLGMGFAAHAGGDPGGFRMLGFKGYGDFYRIPMKRRDAFLKKGLVAFKKVFGDYRRLKPDELESRLKRFDAVLAVLVKDLKRRKK